MKLYVATNNAHKKGEMEALFAPHSVLMPSDEGIDCNPDETGDTFIANSLIKAEALWNIVRQPVIADDSGICVDVLDGRPGIYSARYADGAPNQNELLIADVNKAIADKRLENTRENRSCRFVCALTLYLSKDRFYTIQEVLEGSIVTSMNESGGSGGFGYDPIFYLSELEKTVAQLSVEQKNTISHRAKASVTMQKLFTEVFAE